MRIIKSETERPCARIRDLIQKVEASSTYERQQTCCPKLWPKINEKCHLSSSNGPTESVESTYSWYPQSKLGAKVSGNPGIFIDFFSLYFFHKIFCNHHMLSTILECIECPLLLNPPLGIILALARHLNNQYLNFPHHLFPCCPISVFEQNCFICIFSNINKNVNDMSPNFLYQPKLTSSFSIIQTSDQSQTMCQTALKLDSFLALLANGLGTLTTLKSFFYGKNCMQNMSKLWLKSIRDKCT